jgi:hypothetical protein
MKCTSWIRFAVAPLAVTAGLLLIASPARAVVQTFDDGGIHTVNTDITPDSIEIRNATTVNVETGAVVGSTASSSINTFNSSILNMSGGKLNDELFTFDNSFANITGGEIVDDITSGGNSLVDVHFVTVDDDLEANTTSTMNVYDGMFDEDVESFDSATINIYCGTFQTGADGGNVQAAQNSVINIFGGSFGTSGSTGADAGGIIAGADDSDFVPPLQTGTVNLHAGDITGENAGLQAIGFGTLNVYGFSGTPQDIVARNSGVISFFDGPLQNLTTHGDSVVKLLGSDGSLTNISAQDTTIIKIFGKDFFAFNGSVPLSSGPIPYTSGNLSGVLSDGTVLTNVNFSRNFIDGAVIEIVPEPTAFVLTALALTGLVAQRRRNRVV